MSDNAISSTTQEFLDVYDITNNMTILKDGTVSMILRIGTMNFSLLAEQEQDAIIYTYGALLNSLNYPIQINIQSQTKDATKYLRLLDEQTQKASSQNKANLIRKYRNFVSQLIRERNVLEKKFFIVIPASPGEMGLIAPKNVLPGQTTFDIKSVEKTVLLEKATNILEPRRDHLISQCNRLGLFAEQLETQEIIQNFYINYNPEAQEGQEITNSESYKTPLVRASFSRNPMQDINDANAQTTVNNQTPTTTVPPAAKPTQEPVNTNTTPTTEPAMPVPGQVMNLENNSKSPQTAASTAPVTNPGLDTTQTQNADMPMPNIPPTVAAPEPQTPNEQVGQETNSDPNPMQNNPTVDLTLNQSNINNSNPNQAPNSPQLGDLNQDQGLSQAAPNMETSSNTVTSASEPVTTQTATSAEPAAITPVTATTADADFAEEIKPIQGSINASENNVK